jgi:Ca2+/H+ antiporter
MDTEIIKLIHAIAGVIIALAGFLQILLKKGGQLHRIIGLIYYYTWYAVIITGFMIGSLLITLIGILGWYMSFTGYRFGHRKNSKPGLIDKIVIVLGVAFALGTFGGGLYYLLQSQFFAGIIGVFFWFDFFITHLPGHARICIQQTHKEIKQSRHAMVF